VLELVHSKIVVALVAPEFFSARIARNNFKLALGLALWAAAIDRLPWHGYRVLTLGSIIMLCVLTSFGRCAKTE
jgi:hypothetical protein